MPMINLPRVIYQKYHWFTDFIDEQLKGSPWPNLSRQQIIVLGGIYQGENKAIRIASMIGISRQAVYKIVKELEEYGLISQRQNPDQLNSSIIELTGEGERCVDFVENIISQQENKLIERFGIEKVEAALEVLSADWAL